MADRDRDGAVLEHFGQTAISRALIGLTNSVPFPCRVTCGLTSSPSFVYLIIPIVFFLDFSFFFFTGSNWHLCKTNWYGEIADVIENEEGTLEDEKIKNGDMLVLEYGRLPPKVRTS